MSIQKLNGRRCNQKNELFSNAKKFHSAAQEISVLREMARNPLKSDSQPCGKRIPCGIAPEIGAPDGVILMMREYLNKMAGVLGFEPRDGGTKNRCLTAWLHPTRALRFNAWTFIELTHLKSKGSIGRSDRKLSGQPGC